MILCGNLRKSYEIAHPRKIVLKISTYVNINGRNLLIELVTTLIDQKVVTYMYEQSFNQYRDPLSRRVLKYFKCI